MATQIFGRLYSKTVIQRGSDDATPPPPGADITTQPVILPALRALPWKGTVLALTQPQEVAPPPAEATPSPLVVSSTVRTPIRPYVILASAPAEIFSSGAYIVSSTTKSPTIAPPIIQRGTDDAAPPPPTEGPPTIKVVLSTIAPPCLSRIIVSTAPTDTTIAITGTPAAIVQVQSRTLRRGSIIIFQPRPVVAPPTGSPDSTQPTFAIVVARPETKVEPATRVTGSAVVNKASTWIETGRATYAVAERSTSATKTDRSTTVTVEP